jgi:hypothetical protein
MSDDTKVVHQMAVVNPGEMAKDGDFTFAMQPRWNPARTVEYALTPHDAETVHKALAAYLKGARKAQ